jgi:hypothetical protein
LTQRLLEKHTQRQAQLNCQIGVAPLTARRFSGCRLPQIKRIIADPNRQITAPPQTFIVLSPVGHPLLLFRDLCNNADMRTLPKPLVL